MYVYISVRSGNEQFVLKMHKTKCTSHCLSNNYIKYVSNTTRLDSGNLSTTGLGVFSAFCGYTWCQSVVNTPPF